MREYVRPMMMSEAFAPNEYIAACYTLVCAIPGSSATEIGDGTATRYFNGADRFGRYRYTMWDGNRVYADGLAHGNCGNESTSYDVDHSIGYEHNNDGTVKNAVISNVHIGTQSGNSNMYYAHWLIMVRFTPIMGLPSWMQILTITDQTTMLLLVRRSSR